MNEFVEILLNCNEFRKREYSRNVTVDSLLVVKEFHRYDKNDSKKYEQNKYVTNIKVNSLLKHFQHSYFSIHTQFVQTQRIYSVIVVVDFSTSVTFKMFLYKWLEKQHITFDYVQKTHAKQLTRV